MSLLFGNDNGSVIDVTQSDCSHDDMLKEAKTSGTIPLYIAAFSTDKMNAAIIQELNWPNTLHPAPKAITVGRQKENKGVQITDNTVVALEGLLGLMQPQKEITQ